MLHHAVNMIEADQVVFERGIVGGPAPADADPNIRSIGHLVVLDDQGFWIDGRNADSIRIILPGGVSIVIRDDIAFARFVPNDIAL